MAPPMSHLDSIFRHKDTLYPDVYFFHPEKFETTLCILPLYHVYGLIMVLLTGLHCGNRIVTLPGFKPETFLNTIHNYKVSFLSIVPPMAVFLAKSPLVLNYEFSHIKRVSCGAAPLSGDVTNEVKSRLHIKKFTQGYGLTETPTVTRGHPLRNVPGSSGIIQANTEVQIVDPTSKQVMEVDQRGEIWVKGPQVMKGYYKNPKATAETIDGERWLHTGDVGYFDADGNIFVVDRIKELIKYKGFQVAPAELEALLLTHPGISDAAVIGIPDSRAGELPRAYIVLKQGHMTTKDNIKSFVKENAADFKQPRGGIIFVDAIPKSPSGKILRRMILEVFRNSKL